MKLVSKKDIIEQFGMSENAVNNLIYEHHAIPASIEEKGRCLYNLDRLKPILDEYTRQMAGPPPGFARMKHLAPMTGLTKMGLDRMRKHPDMPKPAGKCRNSWGQLHDYYDISAVLAHAKSQHWLLEHRKLTQFDENDPRWSVPEAAYIPPYIKAFLRWDFHSPLTLS